tara:strand:- start:552 stop:1037 length:486 start_codon:yes stop_codon:yes gene_type:complete
MKKTIIFDLDGTLALIDKRRAIAGITPGAPQATNPQMDWDAFLDPKNIDLDEPNLPVITMAQTLHSQGFKIVIFSGRSASTEDATRIWLDKHNIPFTLLQMRPTDKKSHFMPDNQIKQMWLDDSNIVDKDDIFMTFDDRQQVVDMWRDNGITCFQVAKGDF